MFLMLVFQHMVAEMYISTVPGLSLHNNKVRNETSTAAAFSGFLINT